jgi:hypothetical protein
MLAHTGQQIPNHRIDADGAQEDEVVFSEDYPEAPVVSVVGAVVGEETATDHEVIHHKEGDEAGVEGGTAFLIPQCQLLRG